METILNHKLSETANRVFEYMIRDHSASNETEKQHEADCHASHWGVEIDHWDWNPGVGLIAIADYADSIGSVEALSYLNRWMAANKHKRDDILAVNATAPYGAFPFLFERTNDPFYLEEAIKRGDWLLHEAPRTQAGALQHTVNTATTNEKLREQVWADTIFMGVLFLARLTRMTGNPAYVNEAVRQLELHLDVLQDEQTGVLFHGYNCRTGNHMSAARWTRGNAWIVLGTPLIVEEARLVGFIPRSLEERYRSLIDGLIRYQSANGLWHTVMDYPDYYQESSGSAGIGAGIARAVRLGLLDDSYKEYADHVLKGMLGKIAEDGEVMDVSGGTPIMATIEAYSQLTRYPTLYGQGLALMLLSEYLRD